MKSVLICGNPDHEKLKVKQIKCDIRNQYKKWDRKTQVLIQTIFQEIFTRRLEDYRLN